MLTKGRSRVTAQEIISTQSTQQHCSRVRQRELDDDSRSETFVFQAIESVPALRYTISQVVMEGCRRRLMQRPPWGSVADDEALIGEAKS